MQYFGEYGTKFDEDFLTSSYLYIPYNGETIDVSEFKELIKNKKLIKKNIAGTIFFYNPFVYPLEYDYKKRLAQQEFDFNQGFVELKVENEFTTLKPSLKQYKGKLIEVKYLFNLITNNIDTSKKLMCLDEDCEVLNTQQLTFYDKAFNFQDVPNMNIHGKFVFFAWGNKISAKEFSYIHKYAKNIYDKCVQMKKNVVFIYRKTSSKEVAIKNLQFIHPNVTGRFKSNIKRAIEDVFLNSKPVCGEFMDL